MSMQPIYWSEVKESLAKVNPELTRILDKFTDLHQFPLTLAEYGYGDMLCDDKSFYHPGDKSVGDVDALPFSIVLDKSFEMYIEFAGKVFSFRIYSPGNIINTSRFIQNAANYHPADILKICAGARNAFLLPRIAEEAPHKNICNYYKVPLGKPTTLDSQFYVFRDIARAANYPWKAKILMFSEAWMDGLQKKADADFSYYISSYVLQKDTYFRNIPLYDFLLSYIKNQNPDIPVNSFINDVVRQFYLIGSAQLPGYALVENEEFVPLNLIRETYLKLYEIDQIPFLMAPANIQQNDPKNPVYYSLSKEGLSFKPPTIPSLLKLALDIKSTFDKYAQKIVELGLYRDTIFYTCSEEIDLQLFHERKSSKNLHEQTLDPMRELYHYDQRFAKEAEICGMRPDQFPERSFFFIGCFGLRFR